MLGSEYLIETVQSVAEIFTVGHQREPIGRDELRLF